MPETGEGISVSTLSVDTSSSGSSASTRSPSFLSQRVTVPSVTLSPSWGMDTVTDIACRDSFAAQPMRLPVGGDAASARGASGVHMKGLPGECEMRLADRLRLGGVRVDELRNLGGQRLPVVN